jgi:phosphoenolpyruvate-protein kinase (PTS system EI component)
MGIDAFSVPPRDVLRIRRRIRETDISEVRERMRQIPD